MPSTTNPRVRITAPLATIERLAVEDVQHRRTADAISFESSDDKASPGLCKAAAHAVASRLIAEDGFTWPTTPTSLVESAQRAGVRRASAIESADQLRAAGSLPPDDEPIPDHQACRLITGTLVRWSYLNIKTVRPTIDPAPATPAAVEHAGPPEFIPPATVGRPPSTTEIRQAKAQHASDVAEYHAIHGGKTQADARSIASDAYDAYFWTIDEQHAYLEEN